MRVKKNDTVLMRAGDDRGKKGKVLMVNPAKNVAIVEGINFVKRHLKKGHPEAKEGGVISKEAPVQLSNVMVVCPSCQKPTRVGSKSLASGKRARLCKECGELLEKVS